MGYLLINIMCFMICLTQVSGTYILCWEVGGVCGSMVETVSIVAPLFVWFFNDYAKISVRIFTFVSVDFYGCVEKPMHLKHCPKDTDATFDIERVDRH